MIHQKLLNPHSIVVVGASNDIQKPGGKVLKNLLASSFKGKVYAVNPKELEVQGVPCFQKVEDLPAIDCAILAIAAKYCPSSVEVLAHTKETRGFIILSAGFSEENEAGAAFEKQIVHTINEVKGTLIGPNCTGFLNTNYCGAFDAPIPPLSAKGIDFITGSGATAVFIKEQGITNGLSFNSVWAVGNSAQTGIEDVLAHLDTSFDPQKSSRVIMLYMEKVGQPQKLLKHATSLINKGCRIAAIKSGGSVAGSRAASSHTGALATSDVAVDALFRKAGIVRCNNREELINVSAVFMHPEVKGKNIAIITHAGGPAVMLTDVLSNNGLEVPPIEGKAADTLLSKLFPGSSVANPIDFLATGTAEQLGYIIDACENDFDHIDAMAVIFGSPGLFENWDVYALLDEKMKTCKKPIFPILPSIINVKDEIADFIHNKHRINFPEECVFGNALAKVINTPKPQSLTPNMPNVDITAIRQVIDNVENGYLSLKDMRALLDAAKIDCKKEVEVTTEQAAVDYAHQVGYPLVMKVVGPLHKSDVGGVVLNVMNEATVRREFNRLINIKDTYAVEIYPMLFGTEIYIGASKEENFGHQILFGLGGIFVEVLKDVKASLTPVCKEEAKSLIKQLKGYKIIQGVRGQEGVNEDIFALTIAKVSALVMAAPEIAEMDLNPLLGTSKQVIAVDARIRIEK
ncbi:MAG: acetate--CoA ligase family protein [Bacteroidales bacterium]|jgi:acetyltransferase|nr:acetate--CoA ligase family protein [Bacteroidales bacterium]MDD2687197.1 acetate--CoA ligase family protein [Bacteroidales bacterium]MDD3330265.1 acetate--CoA ligase family protein [Bacteroidales bacterium]MDD3690554.1 acetate--CoA ligase family protein [Bacteroidales bacterium]MDD4043891.1 acetate--CoA ligase family protein [Bacteroidales bacterium]